MNDFSFNIAKEVFNVFSPNQLNDTLNNYHIKKYYYLNQIHSTIPNIVDENYQTNLDGDAMITNLKEVALVIRTADCIPIILYDDKLHVLAAIHSGWKGTLNSIVISTIKKMIATYQVDPKNIKAYLYPSIRKCHFEVDEGVYNMFKEKRPYIDEYTEKKGNKYYIDLPGIVIKDLKDNNINDIKDSNICTYCHHDIYHSYRYNHTDKRNYLVAMIKE